MHKFVMSALLLAPAAALAGSAFDGTWKLRVGSIQVTGKPDVWVITEGTYSCSAAIHRWTSFPPMGRSTS
jgi:hypothetical protein